MNGKNHLLIKSYTPNNLGSGHTTGLFNPHDLHFYHDPEVRVDIQPSMNTTEKFSFALLFESNQNQDIAFMEVDTSSNKSQAKSNSASHTETDTPLSLYVLFITLFYNIPNIYVELHSVKILIFNVALHYHISILINLSNSQPLSNLDS